MILFSVSIIINFYLYIKYNGTLASVEKYSSRLEILETRLKKKIQENERLREDYESSRILSSLVEQSPNAIMLMDSDGNITGINKSFTDMYEYSFPEFINALGSNYRQTSFSPNVQSRLDTIARTKRPVRYEALNVTRTGKEIWTQTALMPILDGNGNISNLVTIDTDIHQRITKSDNIISEIEELNGKVDKLSERFCNVEAVLNGLFVNISELYRSVTQTDQILLFIKEISDETKILGFNASIEASRAGEHGSGFRVITNEIVDISDKTIHSVSQISKIIDSIKSEQNELVKKRDSSEKQMEEFRETFSVLKDELGKVEHAISEFKSLT